MPSKTLLGGVEYEIAKGRALHAGTGYTIQKGRAFSGGVGYDVSHTLALQASGAGIGYIEIYLNGEQIYGTFEKQVTEDDVIMIVGSYVSYGFQGSIYTYFNGAGLPAFGKPYGASSNHEYAVEFVANSDLTISVTYEREYEADVQDYDYRVYITTTGPYTIL